MPPKTTAPMTLEQFQAMKNRHGLVPMVIARSFAPYKKGTVHGFPPYNAWRLYTEGDAVLYTKAAVEQNAPPRFSSNTAAPAPVHGLLTGEVSRDDPGIVEIPDDWMSMHHMKRRGIAVAVSGISGREIGSDDKVREIIQTELDRRAGKAPAAPTAVVPSPTGEGEDSNMAASVTQSDGTRSEL